MIARLKTWLMPSIADVIFISVLFFLTVTPDKGTLLGDGDTGYHIRAGEYILNTLSVPKTDIFSFITPPLPWTAHEWLAEIVMALLHRLGGLTAVLIAFAFIITLSIRMFFSNIRSDGINVILAAVSTMFFISLTKIHWLARPHIFSLIILIFWYRLIDDHQYRQTNRLWLMPLIMLLWVNLHGGFIIGLTMLGIYLAGNLALRLTDHESWESFGKRNAGAIGKALGLSVLACLANPIGWHIFMFPFNLVSNKFIMDHTEEFISPNFHEPQPFKYLLFLIIIILATAKKRPNIIEVVLLLLFTSMSLYSVRYIPLLGVIALPILLRYLHGDCLAAFPKTERFIRQRIVNISSINDAARGYLWPTLSLLLLLLLAGNGSVAHSFNAEKKPLAAIEFLKLNPIAGHMFNNDEFGDILIYLAQNQYKVFMDGRGDMYGSGIMKEYCRVIDFEPGWEEILNKYGISWVFFDTSSSLSRYLSINSSWKLIYSDKVASIFVKDAAIHRQLIEKFPDVKLAVTASKETD